VACGYREKRRDIWRRRVASKISNAIRRSILNDGIRDTGCSLKAFRREHVDLLVPFNGLHRYLPAIFKHAGLRIAETPVNHRARTQGVSKYTNWNRALRGIYDLFGVRWLLNRKVVYPKVEQHNEQ
jgi:dolichol-phosphate mannosyltransferase